MKFLKKIRFEYFLLGLLILSVILIFARFLSNLSFPSVSLRSELNKETPLYPNRPIIQKFSADKDNLNQINVAIRDFSNIPGDRIEFNLFQDDCSTLIAHDAIGFLSFSYPVYTPFVFKKIPDSKNKIFCVQVVFKLRAERSSFLPNIIYMSSNENSGNSFSNTGSKNGEGTVYKRKTLAVRLAYQDDDLWQNLDELNQRMSQYKPWFLKHYFLYVIAFSFILLSISVAILLILI